MFKNYKKLNKINEEIIILKDKKIAELQKELQEAKNLKEILEKLTHSNLLTKNTLIGHDSAVFLDFDSSVKTILDTRFVKDAVTGKTIIKDNGIKTITISKEGEITEGLTEEKPDKGYKYKLIRQ